MIKAYNHQLQTMSFGLEKGSYADLSEMGTGKSLSTLGIINNYLKSNSNFTALIIAPKSIITTAWISDCNWVFPRIKIIAAIGSKQDKIRLFKEPASIYVTNYETMNQGFDFFASGFDMLVCDESVKLKNPRAKWTKAITRLGQFVKYRIILSGLLTPNNLQEIYAPFNFIEKGIFGKSFWSFRSQYFTPDPFSFEMRQWIPKKFSEQKITDKVSHLVIRHTKEKCLDLPEKIHTVRKTEMTASQKKIYLNMKKNAMIQLKDATVSALNKASLIQKLAQISSGFVYDSEKNTHRFEGSGKLHELMSILEGELAGEQVLIFTNFKAESKLFRAEFPDESFIYGGQNHKEQEEMIIKFKAGETQYMFASVSAAKYGLTFTNCSNVIYYSLNYSLDDFAQSQDRIHRIGQSKTCNYIYLLNKGTVDVQIYRALMKKKKLNELIIDLIEG